MENSNNITLYHATNFDYSRRIIKDGAIKARIYRVIKLPELDGSEPLDLKKHLENAERVKRVYLADDIILASTYSLNGSDVVFEVQIPYEWVREHGLSPRAYETIDGVEQIPLERVTKIMSNNPNETKNVLTDSGRLDIMVEEGFITNL